MAILFCLSSSKFSPIHDHRYYGRCTRASWWPNDRKTLIKHCPSGHFSAAAPQKVVQILLEEGKLTRHAIPLLRHYIRRRSLTHNQCSGSISSLKVSEADLFEDHRPKGKLPTHDLVTCVLYIWFVKLLISNKVQVAVIDGIHLDHRQGKELSTPNSSSQMPYVLPVIMYFVLSRT